MKNQINLLSDDFKPQFSWICGEHFLILIVLSLLISLLGYTFSVSYLNNQEGKVNELQAKLSAQQSAVAEMTLALENRVTNPALQNQLLSIKEKTKSRSILVNHIRDLSLLKQRSFSSMFDALGQSSSNRLWLTSFEVNSNNLNLAGALSQPKALPVWIKQLSDTAFFKGQEFNLASVSKEQNGLTFTLTSIVNEAKTTNLADKEVAENVLPNESGGSR